MKRKSCSLSHSIVFTEILVIITFLSGCSSSPDYSGSDRATLEKQMTEIQQEIDSYNDALNRWREQQVISVRILEESLKENLGELGDINSPCKQILKKSCDGTKRIKNKIVELTNELNGIKEWTDKE